MNDINVVVFVKKCLDCKRFTFINEQIEMANTKKDRNIYTTLYKVILYNCKYPKLHPHTVDILRKNTLLIKNLLKI